VLLIESSVAPTRPATPPPKRPNVVRGVGRRGKGGGSHKVGGGRKAGGGKASRRKDQQPDPSEEHADLAVGPFPVYVALSTDKYRRNRRPAIPTRRYLSSPQ